MISAIILRTRIDFHPHRGCKRYRVMKIRGKRAFQGIGVNSLVSYLNIMILSSQVIEINFKII